MTFLVDVVLEYLGRTAVWLVVEALIAAVAIALVWWIFKLAGRNQALKPLAVAGVIGALLGASIQHRFDLPPAFEFEVWRRTVPVVWSLGGALLVAVGWALWSAKAPKSRTNP